MAGKDEQTRFVIDASVVVPWYLEQSLTPISLLFLQRLEHCQAPGISRLTSARCCGLTAKKTYYLVPLVLLHCATFAAP